MAKLGSYTLSPLRQRNVRITKEIDKRTADSKASLTNRLQASINVADDQTSMSVPE